MIKELVEIIFSDQDPTAGPLSVVAKTISMNPGANGIRMEIVKPTYVIYR